MAEEDSAKGTINILIDIKANSRNVEGGRSEDTSSQKQGFNKERDEGISKTAKAGYDYNKNSINY